MIDNEVPNNLECSMVMYQILQYHKSVIMMIVTVIINVNIITIRTVFPINLRINYNGFSHDMPFLMKSTFNNLYISIF